MKNVTNIILTYREAKINLWNNYFFQINQNEDQFNFEIDKAFSLIEKGLFDSLVQAKIFYYNQEPDLNNCWNIYIVPKSTVSQFFEGKYINNVLHWYDQEFKNDGTIFKYNELFDWDQEGLMKCEFIKVKSDKTIIESNSTYFLFKIEDVDFFIENN